MKLGKLETRELIDDSAMNESYKTLRTNLLYTSDLKVISLTSTVANEGKTTTAYYLAKSYAELGKKVLLMDCDLRKGSLKKFFTVKTRVSGISEYVSGQSKDFIYQTDVDGLFVVLSGKKPPNPTELFSNSSFEKMLEALKEEFDLIIIDTPPMGIGADATIIGRNVDGVLMVVRNNFVSKKSVKKVKDDLVRTGSKVIGVVLNRIEKHQSDYYDYCGYY
ncbi:CpsD/CapB family tyrosine-protein kinase [Faecalibacillus intestinalis]